MIKIFLWIHILSAMTYVGGMILLSAAVVPYARQLEPSERGKVISGVGKRFRVLSWVAIGLIIITGFGMLGVRGLMSEIGSHPFLTWKLGLFGLMIALSIVHDVVIGARASSNPKDVSLRTFSSWTGRFTLLLGLVVIYLAVNLNFGL